MWRLVLALGLVLSLAACGGDSGGAATTATPATPPGATEAPAPAAITADDVVAAFVAAGLEAEGVRPMTREDYGAAPFVGEGVRFLIPSLGADKGGRIIVVPDAAERERLATYYRDLGKQSTLFFSHVFEAGDVVVQINGELPDDVAGEYDAALQAMGE